MSRPVPVVALPGQESVWSYPRPPRLEAVAKRLRVEFGGVVIADSVAGFRVLETSHPPVYYLPPQDVRMDLLERSPASRSNCEWKGQAGYFDLRVGTAFSEQVAWSYQQPDDSFARIAGYLAFYAGRVDACYVDEQLVVPQPGNFYGGWITPDLAGPFKGGPGSWGW